MKFRKAKKEDVPFIVEMLANDKLGKLREDYNNPWRTIFQMGNFKRGRTRGSRFAINNRSKKRRSSSLL